MRWSAHLPLERGGGVSRDAVAMEISFYRERVKLLSRFTDDPIVGSLWSKKESCSMQRGLRVDSGFGSFRQTP